MKKIHFAWIEQVLSFDTDRERSAYIECQRAISERKGQASVQIVRMWREEDSYILRIRKPYNNNPIIQDREEGAG